MRLQRVSKLMQARKKGSNGSVVIGQAQRHASAPGSILGWRNPFFQYVCIFLTLSCMCSRLVDPTLALIVANKYLYISNIKL